MCDTLFIQCKKSSKRAIALTLLVDQSIQNIISPTPVQSSERIDDAKTNSRVEALARKLPLPPTERYMMDRFVVRQLGVGHPRKSDQLANYTIAVVFIFFFCALLVRNIIASSVFSVGSYHLP